MIHDNDDDDDKWENSDDEEVPEDHLEKRLRDNKEQIQKMLSEMEKKAKKQMRYLELEGFVEKTDVPGVYKYTPEGLVLAREKYKKMLQDEDLEAD